MTRSIALRLAPRAFALALALSVTIAVPAAAMSCPAPDPWFVQRIALVEPPTLPFGVSIQVVERASRADQWPYDDALLSWIELHNTTATPLYLLSNADEFQKQMGYEAISWSDDDLGAVPTGMKTYLKAQHAVAFDWPYNCAVVRCDHIGWSIRDYPVIVGDGLWGISRGFENRIVRKNNRPANVTAPDEQTGAFTLAYGGRTIVVPFVVTYELNNAYRPAAGSENCGSGLAVVGLVLLIAIVGAVVAVIAGAVYLIDVAKNRAMKALRGATR